LTGRFNFWRIKPTHSGGWYWEVSVAYVPHFYWKYKYVSKCSIATCQIQAKEIYCTLIVNLLPSFFLPLQWKFPVFGFQYLCSFLFPVASICQSECGIADI
jgi:hypothetical protein